MPYRHLWFALAMLIGTVPAWAGGDSFKKHDGSIIVGNLTEVREKSVVIVPEGAAAEAAVEVSYRDLNGIKFRFWDGDPQKTRRLIDTRGKGKNAPEESATIKLRSGKHHFGVAYWHQSGPTTLKLEYSGPGIKRMKLTANQLSHLGDKPHRNRPFEGWDADGFLMSEAFTPSEKGIYARVHEFTGDDDIADYADFKGVRPARYAVANTLELSAFKHTNTHFAVFMYGYLQVPTDGEYTFYLNASNDTVLWFGEDPGTIHPGSPVLEGTQYSVVGADGGSWWGNLSDWNKDTLTIEVPLADKKHLVAAPIPYVQEIWTTPAVLKTIKVDRTGEPTTSDSIYVKAQEGNTIQRVGGVVLGRDGDALQVEFEGAVRRLKMERVVGVVFGDRRTQNPPAQGVLGIAGGHRLPGKLVKAARGQPLTMETAWGQSMEWPYDQVVRYDVRNGRNTWLTDLTPTTVEAVPYFDQHLGWSTNKSLTGGELKIADKTYPRGLCLHSRTVLTYELNGEYQQFQCDLGLQHNDGQLGRAAVRVLTDGQVAHETPDLTMKTGRQELSIDVNGKKTLTLEVDFGENYDVCDHVTFGGAKLIRTGN